MPDELDFVSEFTNANLDSKVSAIRAQAVNHPALNGGACKAKAKQARLTSLSHRTP